MKEGQAYKLKNEIILDVMEYTVARHEKLKDIIVNNLSLFAKHYSCSLKRAKKDDIVKGLHQGLRGFIRNTEGYPTTINQLYNALIK